MSTRRLIGILCVAALAFIMTGCVNGDGETTDISAENYSSGSENTSSSETDESEIAGIQEVSAAYLNILEENQDEIEAYDWQRDVSSDVVNMEKQTALKDITGDGLPELFFMKADSQIQAYLYIYTYRDGSAVEVPYDFAGTDENRMDDHEVAAGVSYVIYQGADDKFYIYYTTGDASITYRLLTYEYSDEEGKLELQQTLENEYGPSEDDTDVMSDVYRIDGETVSNSKGKTSFNDAFRQVGTVILYSGYDDNTIWNKFEPENACGMSAEKMVQTLENAG